MTNSVCVLAALALGAAMAAPASAQHELRIGFVTINDGQHALANKFKAELEKRVKGAIKVSVFPAAQLGKIPRQVENLKLGAQAAFFTPPGFLAGINRSFQVTDAPGIFRNFWHAHNTISTPSFRDPFLKLAENQGIIGIGIVNYGPTSLATLKPIRTLDDMKGLKLRVLASKMESKLASVLGMTGVPMPYTEVLPALQQGTIDGCRAPISVMGASKFFTATKFITVTETGHVPSGMFFSKRWLDKLPKPLQNEIFKLGRELEPWGAHTAYGFLQRGEKLWKDNGAEVIRLSAADQATMIQKLAPLGDEFLGTDPATKDMYGLLKAAVAKASDQPPKI